MSTTNNIRSAYRFATVTCLRSCILEDIIDFTTQPPVSTTTENTPSVPFTFAILAVTWYLPRRSQWRGTTLALLNKVDLPTLGRPTIATKFAIRFYFNGSEACHVPHQSHNYLIFILFIIPDYIRNCPILCDERQSLSTFTNVSRKMVFRRIFPAPFAGFRTTFFSATPRWPMMMPLLAITLHIDHGIDMDSFSSSLNCSTFDLYRIRDFLVVIQQHLLMDDFTDKEFRACPSAGLCQNMEGNGKQLFDLFQKHIRVKLVLCWYRQNFSIGRRECHSQTISPSLFWSLWSILLIAEERNGHLFTLSRKLDVLSGFSTTSVT